jgi:hexosaminidase
MKKGLVLFSLMAAGILAGAQTNKSTIALIPQPANITKMEGSFKLPANCSIKTSQHLPALNNVAAMLRGKLQKATGYTVGLLPAGSTLPASIELSINKQANASLGKEGYTLTVKQSGIVITANQPAGVFYGVQTLLQLFPAEIESKQVQKNTSWMVPAVSITDFPRFGWRGLMFDVSRHFFTKAQVEEFIDEMVKYKYNLLHFHLTDDEGWRIQIKALPKLTEIGAWNVKKTGYFGTFSVPGPNEPKDFGGFYTQEDIKEIIQYAKERFVDVLPEIDVPGHSLAAITAYPDLSCSNGKDNHGVGSGEEIKDWDKHLALVDDNLCPANENVYAFLDKVITEVAALFPFEYIHMGGDETFKTYWEKSDAVKALMQKEGLKNMDEVQSYFEKRVEKIVESKGKKFMGWDEILEGGLAPDAVVMSWRGIEGGVEAAKQGHEAVMSPSTFAYLDYMQGDPAIEPHIYATLRLKKAYSFEPVPDGVNPKFIKGGQANFWTEQVYNMRHLQYMVWPRAFAIAESVWSPKEKKNWNDFVGRVESHFKRYDAAEMKYAPSMYDPIIDVSKEKDGSIKVVLENEIEGLETYYSFDNSFPDNFYPHYTTPVTMPNEAFAMKLINYRNGKPIGRMITVTIADLKQRATEKK